MKRYGSDLSSEQRWRDVGQHYADAIAGPYHTHRLTVIEALLPTYAAIDQCRVVDFGCGEGILIKHAKAHRAKHVTGIDPDEALLGMAQASEADRLIKGGVDALAQIDHAHCIIAANVLAYLSHEEEKKFYEHARRILKPGGVLVVTHSNELFDMFTLNSLTVDFFTRNFDANPSSLLMRSEATRPSFNIRENPLTYGDKLQNLGFCVERQEYINFHEAPPSLMKHDFSDVYKVKREYRDTLSWPSHLRWKLMFQCSMFGVRAKAN